MRNKVLVFDFDGTVALGDGPLRSYARHIAEALPIAVRADFLVSVEAGLEGELALETEPVDGYDLVRMLSDRFEVETEAGKLTNVAVDKANTTAPDPVAECVTKSISGLAIAPPDKRTGEASFVYEFVAPAAPAAPAAAPKI